MLKRTTVMTTNKNLTIRSSTTREHASFIGFGQLITTRTYQPPLGARLSFALCIKRRSSMNYQNETLPAGAVKAGSTPSMTEETVVAGILKKHLAPKGKFGYLVVEEGSLQFVWEDDEKNVLDADPQHPIVIFPERYHHVSLTGKVRFRSQRSCGTGRSAGPY